MHCVVVGLLLLTVNLAWAMPIPDIEPCTVNCNTPIPADWTPSGRQPACGQNGQTYEGKLCTSTVFTNNFCIISANLTGIRYAGQCGCPNDCFNITNQGQCVSGACKCNQGWTGTDCSQIDCSGNPCSNNGTCVFESTNKCKCNAGWAGIDCSIPAMKAPAIVQTVPATQYAPWDEYGNDHPIFNASTIAQIRLYMPAESVEFMLNPVNKDTSEYVHAEFNFDNGVTSKNISDVGVRIKGNISRAFAKKTFKVSFNAWRDDDDNEWDQVDKISLKGFQTDNAYLRDPMSTAVAYSMNAYIQRFGWAQLYINDQSYGYYLILEEVDKNYLNSRFGDNDGALYKCQANLTWIGPELSAYQNLDCGSAPCYGPKTKQADDYTNLRDLIAVINLTPNDTFAETLEDVFDVDLFLRTFVFEVATGNWDGLRDTNNFYLYHNPVDGLWKYIRHDNDATFGALPVYVDVVTNDIYHWADEPRPTDGKLLYDRILTVPEYKQKYSQYLQELFDAFLDNREDSTFREIAETYQTLSNIPVLTDYAHYLDCGLTYYTFNNSFTETFHKPASKLHYGQELLSFSSYIDQRKSSAQQQLDEYFGSLNNYY